MTTDINRDALRVIETSRAAIQCTYHGPTNSRGSRIKVGRMGEKDPNAFFVAWDHSLATGGNYASAVWAYAERMGWGGVWHVGTFSGGAVATWGGWAE